MHQEILVNEWRKAGVQNGDVLLIHSNIKRTLRRFIKQKIRITPQAILESFLNAVGSKGTLLLPLFNFDFAQGIPFDLRNSPSHMGMLSEAGRTYPGAVRTGHPIYSFAAIGHHADEFRNVNNFSGYGDDSPFALLRSLNGKISVLNLPDQNSMTFYHHVEEMHKVSYRYHKTFSGSYTNEGGHTEARTYGLFVRDIERGVLTHVDPAGELMWRDGLYHGSKPNQDSGLRTVSARDMFDYVSDIIETDRAEGLLYRIGNDHDA